MSNQTDSLMRELDKMHDMAYEMRQLANKILDHTYVLQCEAQHAQPEPEIVEPGSPCIDPDGVGCRCYEGCTADCLPSEYKTCRCPRKITKSDLKPMSDPVKIPEEDGYYELTPKGKLIVELVNRGYKWEGACRIAEELYPKE